MPNPRLSSTLTPLIGRERELEAVEGRLRAGARLVSLLGPGGSGKTRIALELAARCHAAGLRGLYVDADGLRDAALLPVEIAYELGAFETPELDARGAVLVALGDDPAVLLVDTVEAVPEAATYLAQLLIDAPRLQVVAASRVPLDIAGEVEVRVPPLKLPGTNAPKDVETSPAGALFLSRARAVGRLDDVDEPTAAAIAELCRRLDGLPLALELAAARTRILAPGAILSHLDQHPSDLRARHGARDDRHASLAAVLSWSLDLLDQNAAAVLEAVAICPGVFDLAMAEAITPGLDALDAMDVLASFGLLQTAGEVEGITWYRLLATVRVAALERAVGSDEAQWRRLTDHVRDRVRGTHEAYLRLDVAAFRRLDGLLDSVRAVLDWTRERDPATNVAIVAGFCWYWKVRGGSREGIARLREGIGLDSAPSPDLAMAWNGVAVLERDNEGASATMAADVELRRIAALIGDRDREVDALSDVIRVLYASTQDVLDRIRELLHLVAHPVSRYQCLSALAWAEGLQSDFSDASVFQEEEAQAALAGSPYLRSIGTSGGNLAQMLLYRGDAKAACGQAEIAVAMLADAGPESLAWARGLHANATASVGRIGEARRSLAEALSVAAPLGEGLLVEVMVAAVAVLEVAGAPLMAARSWGAMAQGAALFDWDRRLAERSVTRERRASDPLEFEQAVRSGRTTGLPAVAAEVVAYLDGDQGDDADTARQAAAGALRHGTLTQRELEVLALLGAGRTDSEIADLLFISAKTASVHISNAKAKLGLATRVDAALWAKERGLVDDPTRGG
jgi:predicted ATPase/DNA-binding CsgD family transcriptional regulator